MRRDLPVGLAIAQIIHAAGESVREPLPHGTNALALEVPGEKELLKLVDRLRAAGVRYTVIIENDAPYEGQVMAVGVTPGPKVELRRFFSSLPLYGREVRMQ